MAAKTVEITTAHNIRIDYELATVSDRIIAFIIDIAIVIAWLIILSIFTQDMPDESRTVVINILFFPFYFLYHLTSESFFGGQSIGKRSMGLKVVRMNGHNPTLGDCLLRWSLRMIDILASFGSLATILVSSTDRNQRLGDMAANTVVIRLNPPNRYSIQDILTLNTQSDYQPTYRDVTHFSDDDMLLVKNTIERAKLKPNSFNKKLIDELCLKVAEKMKLSTIPNDKIKFLRTVLQDYIVLTR